jgi:glycosyltransferase involved in cell wall biosynthesis
LLSFVVRCEPVRILLDYRPALRDRTGVGEYVHELARALASEHGRPNHPDQLVIVSTSWKDRPPTNLSEQLPNVEVVDRRIPVRAITWSWNRLGWPPVEWLAGSADVVHAQSPLLIPTRAAARVITIHDLDFLNRPDRAHAEMRRDYPTRVHDHAKRADQIVVSSQYTAGEVVRQLDVQRRRLTVCSPGAPRWGSDIARQRAGSDLGSTILFVGTLDARKNVAGLLDAYERLRARRPDAPKLVIAGKLTDASAPLVARANRPPLAGSIDLRGYVRDEARPALYRHAQMLVLPSFEEGFGLPVLEAMASGVPVIISNRGSLPEVAGGAATPVAPDDIDALSAEMERLLDPEAARQAISRGLVQASRYTWENCAASALDAYREAIANQARRS